MIYTIIGGVNGVGKSSFSGMISSLPYYTDIGTIVNPDKITAELNGDAYNGAKIALNMLNDCIEKGVDFTQETTLSGHQPINTAKSAKQKGYYIRLFYIGLDTLEESLLRIENRVKRKGHNIPKNVVEKRFDKRFDNLFKMLPYCNEVLFYDNDNGFKEVGEYKNSSLSTLVDDPPLWFVQFKSYLKDNEYIDYLTKNRKI